VTVDGHPICAGCGAAVAPAVAPPWEHVPAGRPYPRRSAWFAPVTWPELAGLGTYRDFVARYPWTARPELCGGCVTSEADWREGVRRLRAYYAALVVLRRRRRLRADENPYLDLVNVLADYPSGSASRNLFWSVPGGLANVLDLSARRRELAALLSWAIPADGALGVLSQYAPLVECGAGTGYWAALLHGRGVDVAASDVAPGRRTWTAVRAADSVAAVTASRGRRLFLCWPPHDDDSASYAAVRAYRGDLLLYLGGGPGGPTGTARFQAELELNWSMVEQVAVPNWPGLQDRLSVYQRNAVRRPLSARNRCASCRRFMRTGAAGRCDACFARRPPAMALCVNGIRVEYPREVVDAMPPGLRLAFERSPSRVRPPWQPGSA
jgi:hypothetical protein